jgi:hypothetical protein
MYHAESFNEAGDAVRVGPNVKAIRTALNALIAHKVDGKIVDDATGEVVLTYSIVDDAEVIWTHESVPANWRDAPRPFNNRPREGKGHHAKVNW